MITQSISESLDDPKKVKVKSGLSDIQYDWIKSKIDEISTVLEGSRQVEEKLSEQRKAAEEEVAAYALSLKTAAIDRDYLQPFFKKPYFIQPVHGKQDAWHLFIPRFIPLAIGVLESQSESYNKFLVNRYAEFLGEIPEAIKREIGLKKPEFEVFLEGLDLKGSKQALEKAWVKYRPFLSHKEDDRIVVDPKNTYNLIAAVIKDGMLPFSPKPVRKEDLVERSFDFTLRPYQKDAWDIFTQYSSAGVFYPASVGKTVIGMYAMTHLKPPHLVVVPQITLVEQWTERIQAHTDLRPEEYVVCTYQSAIKKQSGKKWSLVIYDECQHVPADFFIKLALIQRDYTLGLSATPYREDGRENLIYALTGKPIGLSWQYFKDLKIIKNPTAYVWIVKNQQEKMKKFDELLQVTKKTVIFVDRLDLGEQISKKYSLPFIHGSTKERLSIIRQALANEDKPFVVVSRVGDEGLSLPELERVVELDFLYGSRRQELQRMTRVLHGNIALGEGEHHIVMTADEFMADKKRLFGVMDKGFKTEIHREGLPSKVFEPSSSKLFEPAEIKTRRRATMKPSKPTVERSSSDVDAIYQKVGLPRAPKVRAMMNRGQQRIFDFLIQNDGSFFPLEKLALLLEYGNPKSLANILPEMAQKHWIERKTIEGKKIAYGTQMRAKIE